MPAAFVPGAAFCKGNGKAYRRVALQLVGSAVTGHIRQTSSRPLMWLSSQRRNENEMPRPFVRGSQQFLARHRHEESDMQFPYSTGKALHVNESLSGDMGESETYFQRPRRYYRGSRLELLPFCLGRNSSSSWGHDPHSRFRF
jgi:hypothetical protein